MTTPTITITGNPDALARAFAISAPNGSGNRDLVDPVSRERHDPANPTFRDCYCALLFADGYEVGHFRRVPNSFGSDGVLTLNTGWFSLDKVAALITALHAVEGR